VRLGWGCFVTPYQSDHLLLVLNRSLELERGWRGESFSFFPLLIRVFAIRRSSSLNDQM
jgi:hypothetical protein